MVLFTTAFFMVFLAEMGDKTQLIAMMFATRYPWPKVMLGIFFASVANHLLAITAGHYLNGLINQDIIQLATAVIFILCGLLMFWSSDDDEESSPILKNRGIVLTVFTVFFLGEFGDKTQLAAFTLAAQTGGSIWLILAGTTSAMLAASAIGIFLGTVLQKYCKGAWLKYLGALLFIGLGLHGLYNHFF